MEQPPPPHSPVPGGLLRRLGTGKLAAAELQALLPLLQREAEHPPRWLVTRAMQIPRDLSAHRPTALLTRLVGQLIFDSGRQSLLVTTRSAGTPERVQIYTAGPVTVELTTRPGAEQSMDLLGQVLFDGALDRLEIAISRKGSSAPDLSVPTNELGYFARRGLAAAHYTLRIYANDLQVTVPGIG